MDENNSIVQRHTLCDSRNKQPQCKIKRSDFRFPRGE